jgi:hypothetical protein
MKAAARILVTATTLAALSTLGLAATASVPPADERPQHPTITVEPATVPHPGHGAQVDRDDAAPVDQQPQATDAESLYRRGEIASINQPGPTPATASQLPTDRAATPPAGGGRQLAPVLAVTLLGLLLALAGAIWLQLRQRPREAV